MRDQVFRVFVADGKADRRRRNAGLGQLFEFQFGMRGQGRATDDRVALPQADHVVERRRQAVEEPLEGRARDAPHVDREQRRWQTEEHELFA